MLMADGDWPSATLCLASDNDVRMESLGARLVGFMKRDPAEGLSHQDTYHSYHYISRMLQRPVAAYTPSALIVNY